MTLHQYEKELEMLETEADAIAAFLGSLETSRLYVIGRVLNDELALRREGKPSDKAKLH